MKYLFSILLFIGLISCDSDPNNGQTNLVDSVNKDSLSSNETTSTASEQLPKNDLSEKNLKGAVKEREVWVYEALIKEGYVTNGALKGGLKVTYNQQGNEVTSISYNAKKEAIYNWKHSYDEEGFLVKSTYKDPSVERVLEYTNDKNGNPLESKELINGEEIKITSYFFNEDNLEMETKEVFVKQEGGNNKRMHSYDENNNRRETLVYDASNSLNLKQLFAYDEYGRETQRAIFNGDNSPSYKRTTEYDEKGNPTQSLAFNENGQINANDCFKYSYKYDEKGNWKTRTERDYNDVATQFAEQTVTYH